MTVDRIERAVLPHVALDRSHHADVARMRRDAHADRLVAKPGDRREAVEEHAVDSAGRVDHVRVATAVDESFAEIEHVPPGTTAGGFDDHEHARRTPSAR